MGALCIGYRPGYGRRLQFTHEAGRKVLDSQHFSEASARAERKVLWDALVNSRYNKVLAARTLGISRSKLYRKLREHGLLAKFEAQ